MKTLLLVVFLGLASQLTTAQTIRPALDEDPVFHQVLARRIEYPRYSMRYFPLYGRIYVGFHISEKGNLTDVTILSPGNTRSGFENEVRQALSHMPPLNPRYEGDYALPVAFCYINSQQNQRLYKPINKLDEKYILNRLLLKEWVCTLDFRPSKGSFSEPIEVWGYYSKN